MKQYNIDEIFNQIINGKEIYLVKTENNKSSYVVVKESLYESEKLFTIDYTKKPIRNKKVLQKDALNLLDSKDYYSFQQIKQDVAKFLDKYLDDGFEFIAFDEILEKEILDFKKNNQTSNSISLFEKRINGMIEYKKISYYQNKITFEVSGMSDYLFYTKNEIYFSKKQDIAKVIKDSEYDEKSLYYYNFKKIDSLDNKESEEFKQKAIQQGNNLKKRRFQAQNLFEQYPKLIKVLKESRFKYPDLNNEIIIKDSLSLDDYMDDEGSEYYRKMVIVNGDLIVKNNILVRNSQLIVLGNIEAKNLMLLRRMFCYVLGHINIQELILKDCRNDNFCLGIISSNYFVSDWINIAKSENNIQSKIVASLFPKKDEMALLHSDLYKTEFNFDKLVEKLNSNQQIINPKFSNEKFINEQKEKEKQNLIYCVTSALLYLYEEGYEYAGFERYSNEITIKAHGGYFGNETYIKDVRGKTGIVEYHHEGSRRYLRKNKRVAKGLGIDPLALLERVEWLSCFYSKIVIGDMFDFIPKLEESYKQEKAFFNTDPYLALFWYMLFTAIGDKRTEQIESVLENAKQIENFDFRLWEYFQITKKQIEKDGYFIPYLNPKDDDEVKINEKIKANFLAHKYECLHLLYPDNFEYLIKSYEHPWRNSLVKTLQILQQANKSNNWQILSRELKNLNEKRLGVLFLQIFNPQNNTKNQDQFFNSFVEFLNKKFKKKLWQKDTNAICDFLWNLKDRVPQNLIDDYKKEVDFYFDNKKTTQKYIEIQNALGIKEDSDNTIVNEALVKIDKEIEKLEPLNKITSRDATLKLITIESIFNEYLENYSNTVLFKIIDNLKGYSAKQRALIYLFNHKIEGKKETMVKLWMNVAFDDFDVPIFFANTFPFMVDSESENIEVIKEIMTKNSDDFSSNSKEKGAYGMLGMFLLPIAHKDMIFDLIIKTILQNKDMESIKNSFLFRVFNPYNESESINPTLFLNQEQITTLLNTIWEVLKTSVKNNINNGADGGINCLYRMRNTYAKAWLEEKQKNQDDVIKIIDNSELATKKDKILKNINKNLQYGLDDIKEHNSFLLVKQEKDKYFFFEYFVYGNDEDGYGRVIYEGSWQDNPKWNDRYGKNKNEKSFKNKEEMIKERQEILDKKLAEGFVDFYKESS